MWLRSNLKCSFLLPTFKFIPRTNVKRKIHKYCIFCTIITKYFTHDHLRTEIIIFALRQIIQKFCQTNILSLDPLITPVQSTWRHVTWVLWVSKDLCSRISTGRYSSVPLISTAFMWRLASETMCFRSQTFKNPEKSPVTILADDISRQRTKSRWP
jgi:hypothetical protein